jgi:hypothetical protein
MLPIPLLIVLSVSQKNFAQSLSKWTKRFFVVFPGSGRVLHIDPINEKANVAVNGIAIVQLAAGGSGFSLDISPFLHSGFNEISVKAVSAACSAREFQRMLDSQVWLESVPTGFFFNQ